MGDVVEKKDKTAAGKPSLCCGNSPTRYGHQLAGPTNEYEGFTYEQLTDKIAKIEDMVSDPRSRFRGTGKEVYNHDNYLKYDLEDWLTTSKRTSGTRQSYLELRNRLRSAGYPSSSKGQGFRKNTKLNMSPEGKIMNAEYLD